MRDFKNPTYDGPDCVCCKKKDVEIELDEVGAQLVQGIIDRERERALKILERKLNEMIAKNKRTLSRNDLNDLIDEIAFSKGEYK